MTRFNGSYKFGFYKNLHCGNLKASNSNSDKSIIKKNNTNKISNLIKQINYSLISKLRIMRRQPPVQEIKIQLKNNETMNHLKQYYHIKNKYEECVPFSEHLIKKR